MLEPIAICTLNKLKSIGKIQEIRLNYQFFYKGNLKINDLDDTLVKIENNKHLYYYDIEKVCLKVRCKN